MSHAIRKQFPSLSRQHNGHQLIYLDGPAGTQVPNSVIDAVSNYYKTSNANSHGHFITTKETDVVLDTVREKAASLLGASGSDTISLGANMTSLNFSLSRAIGRVLNAGDEVLITQLDHESNRQPWLSLREKGIIVREVKLKSNGTLDYKDFENKLNENTRLVAMGYAANIFGTVNDVHLVRKMTYKVGAWLLIDAVHAAPHLTLDVNEIGCDFLLCSAYKFYGPHIGILYCKKGLLERLPTDNLRTAYQHAPYSIENGTPNHAALAGVSASIDFIASFGKGDSYREKLVSGMAFIQKREKALVQRLYKGLSKNPKIKIYGPPVKGMRAPTLAFTYSGKSASDVCRFLAEEGICAWDGHFYAIRATEVLGLLETGGVVRMGMAIYNTKEEIDRTIEVLKRID